MKTGQAFLIGAVFLLAAVVLPGVAVAASGDVLFQDTFSNLDKIDEDNTTAVVDVSEGKVQLPQVGHQSFDIYDDAMVVQNGNLIELYTRLADGSYQKITNYTASETVALDFSSQGYSHYLLRADGTVQKIEYAANEFVENPVYRLAGLQSAVTIAASEGEVFVGDSSSVTVYAEALEALAKVQQLDPDMSEPILQTSAGPEQEIVVSGKESIHVFRLAQEGYVESPSEALTGVGYGVFQDEQTVVGIDTALEAVKVFRETGEILNINHSGVVSVQALPGLVYVRDGDSITEYAYDGTEMVPVNTISGLASPLLRYLSPRQYQSVLFNFTDPAKRFGVIANTNTPDPTTVEFSLSPDGVEWYPVIDGIAELPDDTTQLILRAGLSHGGDQSLTPEVLDVEVTDSSLAINKLETTDIIRDPGGNPSLPTEQPVRVTAGYNFDIYVTAPGAETVWIDFSNGESITLTEEDPSTFTGSHYFPGDTEIGTSYDATVYARDGSDNTVSQLFPDHYYIADNISDELSVFDVK